MVSERVHGESIEWLVAAIRRLPSDKPVPDRTPGYSRYNTQKDHWLGWLQPGAGTGTYPRAPAKNARGVYNRIVEAKLLLWLIEAAHVRPDLVTAARSAAEGASSMAGKSAAIRKHVPWHVVAEPLKKRDGGPPAPSNVDR